MIPHSGGWGLLAFEAALADRIQERLANDLKGNPMRNLVVHILVFALVFGFPGALTAGNYNWIGQGGEKKWQSHAEFTGRGATNSVLPRRLSDRAR